MAASDVAFVDTSSVVLLSAADRLDILRCAGDRIVVPDAVATELQVLEGEHVPGAELGSIDWVETVADPDLPSTVLAWDLGPGESAVVALAASEQSATAVLDDLAARRCAAAHRVRVIGTVGLVVRAKRLGLIRAVKPVIEELIDAGMYLSDSLVARVLNEVGE